MSSDIAIKIENLSKCYEIYEQPRDRLKQFLLPKLQRALGLQQKQYFKEFWALRDVTFEVKKGETVGIIGRNGSGKSTLLQMICGTLNPTSGAISTHGRIAALLELGSGFNPEFTGRENIYLNATVLGLSKEEIDNRFDDIIAFADVGDFMDRPVKAYSSGMVVRLAFSVSINVSPEILIVDEALAVGDAAFQRKCMRKISELSEDGMTLLFVSHDIESVRKICSSALYLNSGMVRNIGVAKKVCIEYERDLFGAAGGGEVLNTIDVNPPPPSSNVLLDPELLKSHEKVYGDGRAKIFDVSIKNGDQQIINLIEPGKEFAISYRVRFLESSFCPIFGMMITNKEGVCVFGTNTENHFLSLRQYTKGEEVEIKFQLSNNLAPGIYYLTCGIHSGENESGLIYLQRRMDILIFKCIASSDMSLNGTANLFPVIK